MFRTTIGLLVMSVLAVATGGAAQGQDCDGPKGLTATVQSDGIFLDWEEWAFARTYEVQRAEGDGDFEVIAVTNGDNPLDGEEDPHTTEFLDTEAEDGVSYRYQVQAFAPPPRMSDICGTVEATAVPFFPGAAVLLAAIAGVAGYVRYLARRR